MTVEAAKAPAASAVEREGRRTEVGLVLSAKMEKTIVVSIGRISRHPKFEKQLLGHVRLYAHDEKKEARENDLVEVTETRPLSKLKRWRLVRVVQKAKVATVTGAEASADVAKVKGGHKGKGKEAEAKAAAPAKAKAEAPSKPAEKKADKKAEKKGEK